MKNESKYHRREIVSRNSRTNIPSSCISEFICIFVRIFVSSFYYFKQRNESQGDFDTWGKKASYRRNASHTHFRIDEKCKQIDGLHVKSFRNGIFSHESFLKLDEILKSTRVSFECNSRRQEVTRPAWMVRPFPSNYDVNQISRITKQSSADRTAILSRSIDIKLKYFFKLEN